MGRSPFYRTSYSRAVVKYANNAFLAPYLDADDIAYIEDIRERGCIGCGSLAEPEITTAHCNDRPSVLLEELDFWQTRFGVDPSVERISAPLRIMEEVAAKELGREKYQQIRRAKAERREADKAAIRAEQQIAQEEWAREQAELAKEREANLKRTLTADLEWEQDWEKLEHRQANNYPPHTYIRDLRDGRFRYGFDPSEHRAKRHYVPEWKRAAAAPPEPEPLPITEATSPTPAPPRGAFAQPRPVLDPSLEQKLRDIFAEWPRQWSIAELIAVLGREEDRELIKQCCIELGHDFKPDPPTFTQAEIDKILDDAIERRDHDKLKAQLRIILAPKPVPKRWTLAELMELTETNDESMMRRCCLELIKEGTAQAHDER